MKDKFQAIWLGTDFDTSLPWQQQSLVLNLMKYGFSFFFFVIMLYFNSSARLRKSEKKKKGKTTNKRMNPVFTLKVWGWNSDIQVKTIRTLILNLHLCPLYFNMLKLITRFNTISLVQNNQGG